MWYVSARGQGPGPRRKTNGGGTISTLKRRQATAWDDEGSRDSEAVRELKKVYNYTCQLCNHPLTRGEGEPIVSGYYLQPPEDGGPDAPENLLILCPNHRALFEAGAFALDLENRRVTHVDPRDRQNGRALVVKHRISPEYAAYHNRHFFKG